MTGTKLPSESVYKRANKKINHSKIQLLCVVKLCDGRAAHDVSKDRDTFLIKSKNSSFFETSASTHSTTQKHIPERTKFSAKPLTKLEASQ
jgi:predicted secreted protein